MRNKNKPDFVKLLNYNLSYNPIFENLYKTTTKILDEQIGEPIAQLSRIRSSQHIKRGDYLDVETNRGIERSRVADVKIIEENGSHYAKITLGLGNGTAIQVYKEVLQDRKTLINQAAFAGVDYYSDYISDVEYARLVDYAGCYWKYQNSGERDFINFIGFIKGMRLSLVQLWTRDRGDYANDHSPGFDFYEYLKPEEEITNPMRLENGATIGSEYLTSHVDMTYDVLASPNVQFNDLINLFYYFAPIELVLNRIISSIEVNIGTYSDIAPQIDSNLLARYDWKTHSIVNLGYTEPIPQIDLNLNGYLFLNNDLEEIDPFYEVYTPDYAIYPRVVNRYAVFSADTDSKINTIQFKSQLYKGITSYIALPGNQFTQSITNAVSSYSAHPWLELQKSVNFTAVSNFNTSGDFITPSSVNFEVVSTYSSNSTITISRSISYEGVTSHSTSYGVGFDDEAFDDGFM